MFFTLKSFAKDCQNIKKSEHRSNQSKSMEPHVMGMTMSLNTFVCFDNKLELLFYTYVLMENDFTGFPVARELRNASLTVQVDGACCIVPSV